VTVIENYTFEDEEVVIDHIDFVNCTFRECTLVYHGTGEANSEDSEVIDCEIEIRGPAENGLRYLRTVVEDGAVGPVIGHVQEVFPDSTLMVIESEEEQYRYVMDLGPVPDQELEEMEMREVVPDDVQEEE